jgi:hypothetical protein
MSVSVRRSSAVAAPKTSAAAAAKSKPVTKAALERELRKAIEQGKGQLVSSTTKNLPGDLVRELGEDQAVAKRFKVPGSSKEFYVVRNGDGDQFSFRVMAASEGNVKDVATGTGYGWSDGDHVDSFKFVK